MKVNPCLKLAASAALLCSWIAPSSLRADDTSANISIGKMITNLKISGDIRLRQENFWKASAGQRDRSRQRYRFRLGIQSQIQDITIGFRMASGTGEQVSTNQSFDNLSSQKQIWIDQAYVQWKAFTWLSLPGVHMENPFWRVYSSDVMWDGDVNPEGFAQKFEYRFHERFTGFANFGQFVLDEDSTETRDQWMFGHQVGMKTKILEENYWTLAGTLYQFKYENLNNFAAAVNNEGGTRKTVGATTDIYAASFTIVHLTQEISAKLGPWPFKLHADYVKNVESNGPLGAAVAPEQAGYQIGGQLGKAGAAKTWEVAYYYKWLETNAVISDLADSDFGDGGTNRRGHILWIGFAPRDYINLTAKLFVTEVIRPALPPGSDNINRLQLDMSVKF
jgi:hypothetical protein